MKAPGGPSGNHGSAGFLSALSVRKSSNKNFPDRLLLDPGEAWPPTARRYGTVPHPHGAQTNRGMTKIDESRSQTTRLPMYSWLKDRLSSFQTCFQTRTKLLSLTLLKKLRTKLRKRKRRKLMISNVEMFLTGFGIDRRSAVLGWGTWRDMNTFHPVLDFLF